MATMKIQTAFLFLCAGAAVARVFFAIPSEFGQTTLRAYQLAQLAATISPLVFLIAGGLVFYRARAGYILGLAGCVLALPWFSWIERAFVSSLTNSWIQLNLPDEYKQIIRFAEWRILAIALVATALGCSVLRLLPSDWTVGKWPVSKRTWPAFALSLVLLTAWYATSVAPYRIPYIVDASWPRVTILHVQKHGLQFHETGLGVRRDGRFDIWRNNRRWFQYRFATNGGWGVVPEEVRMRATALVQAPELSDPQTAATPLRRWDDEGWYILVGRSRVLAFVHGAKPPANVTALFSAIENLSQIETRQSELKDVCLGFCYDPTAGLGFMYVNERCHSDTNGNWCQ